MIESAEEFVRLRSSKDPSEYRRAGDEEISEEVCRDVIERFPDARAWLAESEWVPTSTLRRLATDGNPRVRSAVCARRILDATVIEMLSWDVSDAIRTNIARRSDTPVESLLRLVKDDSSMVREAAIEELAKRKGGDG